jgi:putative (di)nucleoside polyphosphate hydrolase
VAKAGIETLPYRPAVGIMLLNRRGEAFVARRIDMPMISAWQMPQGGIDAGETPRQAALRELREEIGTDKAEILGESAGWLQYDLPPDLAGEVWGGRYRGQRQKWFVMRFTGSDADINLATEHPEFDDWRWVAPDGLPELIVPFKRQLYIDILAEFQQHCRPPT